MQNALEKSRAIKGFLCALAEIAPLIDVVVGHSYLSNRFHHLVELWCAQIPLALPRAAAENMSFYFFLFT